MNIIRLVVLGLLIYFGWRIIRNLFGSALKKTGEPRQRKQSQTDAKVEDVLVEDPQCHKLVPKSQAIRCRFDGETHYFCSDTCCDKFSEKQRKEA